MGNVVSDGESLTCPFCTAKIKLGVSSSAVESDSKKIANTNNHSFSAPGAQCIVVPSAPKPCQPNAQNVDPGQSPLSVGGSSALGAGCKWMCAQGGLITISSAAQSSMIHNGAANADSYNLPGNTSYIEPDAAANENHFQNKEDENKIVAQNIANGHAYDKHILGQPYGRGKNKQVHREFPGGMRTRTQYQEHAEKVMNNSNTPRKISNDNRAVAYWDEDYGAIIIKNKTALDKSTMFQPKNGKIYYDNFN